MLPFQNSHNEMNLPHGIPNPPPHMLDGSDVGTFGLMEDPNNDASDKTPKRKGRKKSFIWSHVVTDDLGKVHCRHCNQLIRVNYGEKVERLRRHFVKSCPKSPFEKDSKEYEELLESVNAPQQENKKKSYMAQGKSKSNRVIAYSVGFVTQILSSPTTDLTPEQIAKLESQGNYSSNWSNVKLITPSTVSYDSSIEKIRGCNFSGNVFLGMFAKPTTMEHGITVPSGLYNSNFSGTCVLSDNCYVFNTSMLSNVFIGRNSCIINCSVIACEGQTSYGTQKIICVGAESEAVGAIGSRNVALSVNTTYSEVCINALLRKKPLDMMDSNANDNDVNNGKLLGNKKIFKTNKSDDCVRYDMTIICDDVEISQCHLVRNSFIGSYSRINNSSIDNSTLLSHCTITFSELADSVLHGSCSITSRSTVHATLMFPHSHVSNGGNVADSVLAPDSSVSIGECKRSILGPHVGFHHQSLLIATLWPMGRGNIAHGAMIGANHTSRSNDQESQPGEGCFFGLGSSVRFPFSMLMSPYSLIAAGTTCYPQNISYPFSLLSDYPSSNTANTLRIGWVLWSNAYFIERTITKFTKRRKSSDYRTDIPIFRPSIVDMVVDARARLMNFKKQIQLNQQNFQGVLITRQHLAGVGVSIVPFEDVDRAIEAYSQFIFRYLFHGLLYMIANGDYGKKSTTIPSSVDMMNKDDSDSEDDEGVNVTQNFPTSTSSVTSPSSAVGPIAFLIDDLNKMEDTIPTIEDSLYRGNDPNAKRDNKKTVDPLSTSLPISSLIGRNGTCCLLTDSHDITVRRHQFNLLQSEVQDINFGNFIDNFTRNGYIFLPSQPHPHTLQQVTMMKQLLHHLIDLERRYAENVYSSKQKDNVRSLDIILGPQPPMNLDQDETVLRARQRAEEVALCVQRILSQV